MKLKRLIASLLAAAAVLALSLPAFAASSFSDVYDDATAVNADVLRLMGVVKGAGQDRYYPDSNLTRAEFCAMAIRIMGRESEVAGYTNRTIFSDVTSKHWGRGYVNLATSITVGEGGTRLIMGVGDGRFLPNEPISYAEAVTILCRVLGYGDDTAGGIWPTGYVNLAAKLGLNGEMDVSAVRAPITRAQAAQLFVNLLCAERADGQKYYAALGGQATEHVMILAVGVSDDSGLTGAIRTSLGTYAPAVSGVIPTALEGCRGALVLNSRNEIMAFVPDGSVALAVTLDGSAQATSLRGTDGVRYSIPSTTPAFTGNSEDKVSTYADLWRDLGSGDQVTLFLEGNKVVGVYRPAGYAAAAEAFIVNCPVTATNLLHMTGGAEDYTIRKNGDTISLSQLKTYDVLTYDAASNTMLVSDLRIGCVYEHAAPNPTTPETITVLGHEFKVLPGAGDTISQFKLSQSVTLLLTADGQVAGMVKYMGSNLMGLAGSDGVTVELPSGGSFKLSGNVPAAQQGRLVTAYGSKGDVLNVSAVPTVSVSGDFDREAMTLGSYKVSAGVRIYESADGTNLIPIDLSQVEEKLIPYSQVLYCHRDSSGVVDVIVIKPTTGDNYTYGILSRDRVDFSEGSLSGSNGAVVVTNGGGKQSPIITAIAFENGCFGGVVAGSRTISGTPVAADVVTLTQIGGVHRSDFFRQNGVWYVRAGGASYEVAEGVEGYIKATGAWFGQAAGEERLEAIRDFSNNMTVCIDPIGQKVRVIVVE